MFCGFSLIIIIMNDYCICSASDLAKSFMRQNISNNSLSFLGNISGWCKLLMSTDEELNLQHRFLNNLYHSLNQSI